MAKPCSDGRRFEKEKLDDDWAIVGALEVVVAVQDDEVVVVVDGGGGALAGVSRGWPQVLSRPALCS